MSLETKLVSYNLNPFYSFIIIELSIIFANLCLTINYISSNGSLSFVSFPKNINLSFKNEWKYNAWFDTNNFP